MVTVSVELPGFSEAGEKLQAAPAGTPLHDRLTVSLEGLRAVTVTV